MLRIKYFCTTVYAVLFNHAGSQKPLTTPLYIKISFRAYFSKTKVNKVIYCIFKYYKNILFNLVCLVLSDFTRMFVSTLHSFVIAQHLLKLICLTEINTMVGYIPTA